MATKERYRDPGTPPLGIKERNIWFNKLNVRQKKVAVARDVLQQMRIKRIIPEHGVYLMIREAERQSDWNSEVSYTGELQNILISGKTEDGTKISCHACGIGSILLGKARLGDDAHAENGSMEREDVVRSLAGTFTRDELYDIESIFEAEEEGDNNIGYEMCDRGYSPEDRVRVLMNHIIETKGLPTFDDKMKLPRPR